MKGKFRTLISGLLTIAMLLSTAPTFVFAAQSNEYVDPADSWISANGRTNELDVNATTTYETQYCFVCDKHTTVITYRVPEYTKSGETALNRGVMYSDSTLIGGEGTGNLDDGTPGVNAYYTSYHWTKAVCQNCGTINTINGPDSYGYNRNVYNLNSCDHNFFLEFDNTTYEHYNDTYHTTIYKAGEYCQFCKGTSSIAEREREAHNFIEHVDGQVSNNRFYITETCEDCGFVTSEYVAAKSVVSSYYGEVDGSAHTVSVEDLSENGVHTSIRYGTSANDCYLTSAPNYTEAGYYPVYYEIDYRYSGNSITENGVSYVWLLEEDDDTIILIPPTKDEAHEHDYHYLETIEPNCENLGYDRFQCNGCGDLIKTNYIQSTGHKHEAITIRESTCKQGGLKLWICGDCGDFYEETTPLGEHTYKTKNVNPTCKSVGYKEHTCELCGDSYITDMTAIISHSFEKITKEPTCTEKGYTTSTCTMCGLNYVSDYTDPTGHEWDEGTSVTSSTCEAEGVIEFNCNNCDEKMIKAESATGHTPGEEATCTEPQLCTVCQTVLELPKGHNHDSKVIAPTCTAMGYTEYTCDCGDTYTGDYVDKLDHDYDEAVTEPTCTAHGYTTFTCDCGDEYIGEIVEKTDHNYSNVVTAPTCTAMGFTTYTCEDCGDSYVADYVEMTEHNYSKETIEPTCQEHGYAIYTCPDCGKSYIGDYTNHKDHTYSKTVVAPTCTEMGYTIYECNDCDDEYVSDYTDKIAHKHEGTVTEPTCLELGYTTYVCSECGDTYKSDYKEPKGHTPSEWIIDTPATIENSGSKHIECTECKTPLQTSDIAQLIGRDFTDEDGNAIVGEYNIKLTDENNMPIFNAEITIDVNDKVRIILPNGRLLDFADRTTITATKKDSGEAAADLDIHINDKSGNNATGKTDNLGKLIVPNDKSSTTDENGTIGAIIGEKETTFVVSVTDKFNVIIPNCDIRIGESNNIVVDLPEGLKPTRENPVIVTVADHNNVAQKDITVIAIGESDFIEKGVTDIYGKITLPNASDGYTDEDGKVNVDNINVIVNDESALIPNAYIVHNEDGTISVTLPEEKSISYANRITVTVLDSMGLPMANISVTVKDVLEKSYQAATGENGVIVVPPLTEDMTDSEGKAVVSGYNVLITDEEKPIENAFIVYADSKINVVLPEGTLIDINNRITATITDSEGNPVKDMSVTFTDGTEKSETNLTDENGKATVPPTNIDYTDVNGYSEVEGYIVTVKNEIGAIEKAYITYAKVENAPVAPSTEPTFTESISVLLPNEVVFDYENRITITVLNKADKTAVKDMNITATEATPENAEETFVAKSLNGITDKNGIVVLPPLSEDITDEDGKSDISEDKETEGEDTNNDGEIDKPGETISTLYNVAVSDTKGAVNNAFIKITDGKVNITLPDTHTLTTSNQTTVTVTDKDGKAVSNVPVTVTDKNKATATQNTNANGQVVVPVKTSSGGGGSSSGGSYSGGGGGGGSYSSTSITVKDKDDKTVSVTRSTTSTKATLTLPTGKNLLKDDNFYTITVKSGSKAKADYEVVLKDKNGNEVTGKTDDEGIIILPAKEHNAYIFGYNDGTFRPDNDMTRAEASAIFARLIAEEKGETIKGSSNFTDVSSKDWHKDYIGYASKYDIIKGYTDGTFRPDDPVTRAEFVSMAIRYHKLFNEVKDVNYTVKYTDVSTNYWAYKDIAIAKNIGWLNGYADGTFKGDNNITRAEVVTVVNRATGRIADEDYINKNTSILNKFTDLTVGNHWAKNEIFEAANTHMANTTSEGENWIK